MEAEITKNNLKQLKRLRSLTKGTDVSDQTKNITDRNFNGTNGASYTNPIDGYVDSWSDFMKNHKKYTAQAQKIMKLESFEEFVNKVISETLAREDTIKQMKKLRAMTKGTDVSDQISKISKKSYDGTNGATTKNALDGYVDSWEDHKKDQRKQLNKLKTYEEFVNECAVCVGLELRRGEEYSATDSDGNTYYMRTNDKEGDGGDAEIGPCTYQLKKNDGEWKDFESEESIHTIAGKAGFDIRDEVNSFKWLKDQPL